MPYNKKCVICAKSFTSQIDNTKTCSKECRKQHIKQYHHSLYVKNNVEFDGLCLNCSVKIEGKSSRARYCSTTCKSSLKRKNTNFNKQCEICNSTFISKNKKVRFCSRNCQDINFHNIMKKDDVFLTCQWCKNVFAVPYADRNARIVCSYSCSTKLTASKLNREVVSQKISKSHIAGHKNGSIKAFWKGKHLSEETRIILRKKCIERGLNKPENNPMFGKKHSDKAKEAMSKTRSEKILNGKYNSWFKKGTYFSSKLNREILYQSSWELQHFKNLDKDETVLTYLPQPLKISYICDQKRNYIPDILITYVTGAQSIIEIKPEFFVKFTKNIAKFTAARIYCLERNMCFEVWTENDNPYLDKEKNINDNNIKKI